MIPKKLIDEIENWISCKKYGDLNIKFNAGHIVHITRTQSIKVNLEFSNSPDTKITAISVDGPELFA